MEALKAPNKNLLKLEEVKELLPKYQKAKKRSEEAAKKVKSLREKMLSKLSKVVANENIYAEDVEKIIKRL